MSEDAPVNTDNTSLVAVSPESKTWARRMIEQYRAVDALHSAEPRWQLPGQHDGSWDVKAEALAALQADTPDAGEDDLEFFLVCSECSRIEQSMGLDQGLDWTYNNSLWPCRTAVALHQQEETD